MELLITILQTGGKGPDTLIMMLLLFAVFYFFMIRPQIKKQKLAKAFAAEIKKGAKIVTNAGIHGVVDKVNETTVIVTIEDGTKIKFEKSAISNELTSAAYAPKEVKK